MPPSPPGAWPPRLVAAVLQQLWGLTSPQAGMPDSYDTLRIHIDDRAKWSGPTD
jgi:hypothetical protein